MELEGEKGFEREDVVGSNPPLNQDFDYITVVGSGSFADVWKARHVATETLYAIKVFSKERMVCLETVNAVLREKNIMSLPQVAEHPFIITLHYAFQSENRLHIVMDWAPGGDMLALIENSPLERFPEERARVVSAEIILALAHLHTLGITFRDLKPANIIVGRDSHIMLTGLCVFSYCCRA